MRDWSPFVCLTNQKKKVSIIFLLKRKKKYLSFIIKTVLFDFGYLSSIRRADDVERPRFLMGLDLTRVKIHGIIIWIRRCYITTIEHPASAASPVECWPVQIFFIRSLICVRSLYRKAAITSQYETRNANVIPPPLSLIKSYFFKKKDEAIYWWYYIAIYSSPDFQSPSMQMLLSIYLYYSQP